MAQCNPGGLAMNVKRMYLPDNVWFSGYARIVWLPSVSALPWPPEYDTTIEYHQIRWPLPGHRVYEVAPIGDITYIFLRASAFVREGEAL